MTLAPGTVLTLDIERPAVGGRMIARADGAVVLVAGGIPGERVRARVERLQRGTCFAHVIEVLTPSPDRVTPDPGLACGGQVFAHIADDRQRTLKGEMIADAFRRQARVSLDRVPVVAGPPDGYRTRARAHVRHGGWGFFEERSHTPCGIGASRQLADDSALALERLCAAVAAAAPRATAEVEWVETVAGSPRAAWVHLASGRWERPLDAVEGVDGCAVSDAARPRGAVLWGEPSVTDPVAGASGDVRVRHHVRAFFQGNRHLLARLVSIVQARVTAAAVADLYAGVGLFSLAVAAAGRTVDAVESDRWAAADLAANAAGVSGVTAIHLPVERFLASGPERRYGAVVVDPPRTGLGAEVAAALAAWRVPSIVYVSCDPVTLARDVRALMEAGYVPEDVLGVDLFPRTAHVETVVTLGTAR